MAATLATIFARMSHGEIRARTETILKALTAILTSLEPWSPFIATVAQLQAVYDRFVEADNGAQTGNFLATAERNAVRPELNQILTEIGDYMELGARKDPSLLLKTCFDVRPAKRTTSSTRSTLVAPANFDVKHGKVRGTLLGKLSKVPGAKSYEIHVAYGDPTVEENWSHFAVFGKCSIVLKGFEPGKYVSLRGRGIGSESTGPWSHPVTIMPV